MQKIHGFKSDQVHHCRFSVNDKGADQHLRRFSVNDRGADQHLRRLQKDDKGQRGSTYIVFFLVEDDVIEVQCAWHLRRPKWHLRRPLKWR